MATLPDVWDALADALAPIVDAIEDLTIVQGAYADVSPPAIEVYPGAPSGEEGGFGPDSVMDWVIRARVSDSDSEGQQILMAQLMEPSGPTSISEMLTGDQTLGGVVETLKVNRVTGFEQAGSLIVVIWTATVYNTPTTWS